MQKTILELQNVFKTYHLGKLEVPVLKGINVKIRRGEFVSITGPSGCGKSTCMHIMGCLDTPTSGKVMLGNKDVSKLSDNRLAEVRGRKIGFVFQVFNLIPSLTVIENVMLPMMFQNVPKLERVRKATELLEMIGLEKRLDFKPTEISGGEQQRTAISRALANDPEIILADEPTGNLDSKMGGVVIDFLKKINRENNKTIIIVTHDMNVAKQAERMIHLKDGFVVGE
ncbi:MAG: ABC transporter ATP-binding protein [Candidatus Aenigmatarchaeota archaeon]